MPRTLGIRPALIERTIEEIAAEILALTKLNWNRARLDGKKPITLLTAERVGQILRHVPRTSRPHRDTPTTCSGGGCREPGVSAR